MALSGLQAGQGALVQDQSSPKAFNVIHKRGSRDGRAGAGSSDRNRTQFHRQLFRERPQTTVTGQFIYKAPTLTSDITSLTSVDLTIGGHAYTLGELGFSGSLFPGTGTIGTIDPGLGIVDFGKDTFSLSFDLATV